MRQSHQCNRHGARGPASARVLVALVLICVADSVARAQTVISAGADVGQFLNASTGGVPNWSASSYRFALGGNARWNTANQFNTAGHLSLDVDGRGSVVTRAGNNVFTLNSSTLDGATISLRDLTFSQTGNSSAGIFRDTGGTHTVNVNLERVTFNGLAGAFGNAFYMNGTTDRTVMVINAGTGTNGVTFSNNTSTGDGGGVISMYGGTMTFNGDYTFDTNTTANYGGAIAMYQNNGIMTFNGATTFRNNRANNYFGGAIDIWGGASTLTFNGASTFTGNYVVSNSTGAGNPRGGAINIGYTSPGSGASVVRFNAPVTFDGNYVVSTGGGGSAYGGAISAYGNGAAYNYQYIFTAPALFQNNYAIKTGSGNGAGNGGAIYYDASGASLSLAAGTRFLNNASSHLGGAIFLQSGTITLDADTGDTLFQGNRHGAQFDGSYRPVAGTGTPNAIYLGSSGTLNFIADAGRRIEFFDPIASSSGSLVTVNKSGDGEVVFHGDDGATGNYVSAITANTTVSGGTFTLDRGAGYGVRTAGIFSVGAATLRGGSSSTLRALALNIGGSSRLEVAGGLFTVDAGTITTQAGTAITGSGTLASTGPITLGGTTQVTVADGNNLAITGVLGGTGGFALGGGGTLVLSGTRNSYTGATGIAAATTLVAGATNALGNSRNVNVDGLLDMSQGNFSQFAGNLTGGGEIRLGSATLTASNTADTTFAGTISGTGALAKTGSGALTLAGANTFSGGLSISAGTVAGNDMQAFGTGDIVNNGTLRLDFASDQAFTNQLSGSGRLVKNGAGTLSFDHDARQGDVSVNAGTLSLQGEAAFSAASLTTAAGAAITLADDSSLTLTNALTQASGASLNLILGNPSVTAGSASIDGTLNVIGFAPTIPFTASGLTGAAFRVLHTTGGIAGDFSTVAFGGPVAALDYLQPTGVKSGNGLDFFVALSLSWNGGATRGHGTFTLADAADAFDVDVALTDQAASATGWNGRDLTKNGSGTLTLSAQNTYTGLTNVNGGTLAMGIANAMAGSSDVTLAAGTALTLNDFSQTANNLTGAGAIHLGTAAPTTLTANNATDGTLSGVIDGAGAFAKAGTGTLTLTGANTYAGGTTVSGGTLIGLNIGAFGTGAIANNAALRFDFADDNTVANALSGTGSLTKNGAGTVTIASSGQQGDVTLNAGGLHIDGTTAFTASNYTAGAGTTTTIAGNAQLNVTNAYTQAGDSTLQFILGNPFVAAGSANLDGKLNIIGFAPGTPSSASALTSTQFTVLHTTDGITGDFSDISFSGAASQLDFLLPAGSLSADSHDYNIGLSLAWNAGATQGNGIFTLATPAGSFDVDVALADQAASATGWNGRDLTKNGSGTLTLSALNTYTGLTTVNGGTLSMGIANAIASSSAVSVNAGATLAFNDQSQTLNNLSGTGTISLGTAGATMLTASNTTDTTFAGTIGGAGGLTKTGTGTLTLSGSNSYSGGTTIGDGTLRATQGAVFGSGIVTNNAALQLDFATDSTLANTLAGAGSLTKTGTGVATIAATGSQGDIAVNAGTLRFGQTGTFRAASLGTADGATTTIDGGAQLSVAGTFTKSANATLNVALDANEPVISAGSATVAGTLNITGFSASVPQTASALTGTRFTILRTTGGIAGDFSAVNLSGSSSAVDYILVGAQKSADNLEYIAGFGLTWRAGTTRSNGAFTLAGASDTFNVDVVLADQAASATGWNGRDLTKNGAGTLTLSTLNTYSGATNVNGGTLSMGIANAIASSSAVSVNAGATLAFNDQSQTLNNLSGTGTISLGTAGATMLTASNTTDTTFAGTIGGAGGLTKTGTGTLTLSGSNSYSGGTTIGDGTLRATQGAVFGSGIVTNNAALQLDFATDSTLANTLAGAGSLTKTGTGVATIAATGSQGDIAVNAGTLRFGQTGTFRAASLGTADGATTTIDGGAQLSVAGTFTKSANATLNVALDANEPVISAGSATVAGTLNITGFSASVPQTASALTGTRFTILRTTDGIAGDFSAVNLSGSSSAVDYILVGAQKSADNLEYIAGFGLTWRAGTTRSNGAFTLAGASDTFNVDVVLADQAASATGWNGRDLTKNGSGTLTLSALNTYTGLTTVNGGTLSMGIANAIASSSAVAVNTGATLALNDQSQTLNNLSGAGTISLGTAGATMLTASNTTDTTFAGTIGGAGGLTKTGTGTLTLSGSNSYAGGTTIASGALAGHAESFGPGNILNHGALLIDAPVTTTMGQAISGTGALVKSGSGMLELTGISNLSGPTSVNGGRLAVNGFLGNSAVTLATGTAIQGIGTVGALHVNAAAVEPGNSIGTLHVNGAYTQGNGGRYIAEVNPESDTSSDRIEVQGKATLEPGAVLVPTRTALSGFSINARYLVLSATEGITGTYTMADDGRGSFYLLQDEYDGYNVYLKTRMYRSFASAAITPNQIATAGALESLPESNPLRDAVGRLNTDDEARAAFDMLSGEIHASIKSALLTGSRYLRDTATDRLRQNGCLPASGEHIATMQDVAMPQANGADCAALDARPQAWARTFGTYDRINGDGNAARMTQNLFGFLVGADATVAPGWRAGALAGYSHGRQSASDRNSSANTDNYHLGLYGGTSWRNLGIRLGASASWHEIDTTRTPVFTGFQDQLKSNYGARTLQAFSDVGYRFALGKMDMEPFANAAFVNLHGNSFNEGSSAAALSADTANDNLTVTTLGLRSALSMETQAGHAWGVTLMAGWQHTFGNDFPLRTMRFAGSAPFTVAGVPVARDAAVVEGGVNARIGSRTWLGFSYSGRFGSHASSQTIQGKLAIRW